jgi:4-amino-4-deoxy-L-arabinose transferase-like glycosyltransferase
MWLGSVGIVLRRTLLAWGIIDTVPFPLLLALMRLPVALVHTAGVLAGYALLRRLLPLHIALLVAFLWAADPFLIAYQRILHVDGLTATFATLSILAACVYWHHARHSGYLVLSAVCGALAVLSKSPGLAVVPVVGVMALLSGGVRSAASVLGCRE